jgi:hypothetical protein
MTGAGWVALAITIFGAFAYAAASILQAVGARRSTGTVKTLSHPLYLLGTGFDLLAWVASMVALGQLAVYVVESVLAGSLAVTVVAARLILKSRLRTVDVIAVTVSVTALTVLAMSAGPQESVPASAELRLWFCGAALAIALLGYGATKYAPPGVVAAFAGFCLGGAALVGRALTLPHDAMSSVGSAALAIVTEPLVAALLVFGVTGMMLYANALQRGQVGPVTAVLWIAEVIAPSFVAVMFLGDTVRSGWAMPAMIAGVVTVGTAVVLASAPANKDTALPAEPVQPALTAPPTRHALPAAPAPAPARTPAPVRAPVRALAERVIWWGPPPIWVPPQRARAALAAPAVPALTWAPPERPLSWAQPLPADADSVSAADPFASSPFASDPYMAEPYMVEPVRPRPWHDLSA